MAESTTRTVSRGFERERSEESVRRREVGGARAAVSARREDASGGRDVAIEFVGAAVVVVGVGFVVVEGASWPCC